MTLTATEIRLRMSEAMCRQAPLWDAYERVVLIPFLAAMWWRLHLKPANPTLLLTWNRK